MTKELSAILDLKEIREYKGTLAARVTKESKDILVARVI